MKRQGLNQATVYAQLRKLEAEEEKPIVVSQHRRARKGRGKTRSVLSRRSWFLKLYVELKVLDLLADKLVLEEWDNLEDARAIIQEAIRKIRNHVETL